MVKITRLLVPVMLALVLFFGSNGVHAYYESEGVFYGSFHYEQQMTDFYSLYPEVKYHEGLPYIWEESGQYYFGGDISYLILNKELYYGNDTVILTLDNRGWSTFEPGDFFNVAVGMDVQSIPLNSLIIFRSNSIGASANGRSQIYIPIDSMLDVGFTFQKNYGYDPDYYLGYEEGYNSGYDKGLEYGEFLHKDDYNQGFTVGKDAGYLEGYDVGFTEGFESTEDGGMWGVLWSAILAPFAILSTEMLPGITLAMIVAVPLVFGLLGWILSTGKSRK